MFSKEWCCREQNICVYTWCTFHSTLLHVVIYRNQKHLTFMWPWIVIKFLIIKPTRCTNFSNLFSEWNYTWFGQFLCTSSGVFHCTHSNGVCPTGFLTACEQDKGCSILILLDRCLQTCRTYTIAVYTMKNSWWWTEELSETCRVSFQE